MQTHTSSSPDEVLAATAEGGPEESLDSLLRQIVGGYFVLTDGQGAVSKWSEPAELLFGRPGPEVLGRPFFDTLVGTPLPAAAEKWRGFLETAEPPEVPGRVEVQGLRAEGEAFPLEAVFVPVKLDEGFDFSLFLEDLGFELPLNLMLLRMRQQHPVVVRALRQALENEPQPWDGWRTAGTLVVFRPLAPTPWVEQELAAREAKRAEADAEVEERLTNPDPGIQGSSVQDLDDAAAVVARLLSAMERIDDLERLASGLPAQVDQARKEAEARAEAAEAEARRLREDLRTAVEELKSAGDPERRELLARMDRLEHSRQDPDSDRAEREAALKAAEAVRAELAARLDRLEAERANAAADADARLAAAVEEARERAQEALEQAGRKADSARSAFESRIVELEKLRSGDAEKGQSELAAQLERVRAEHEEAVQSARHELAETIERLERDRERHAEAARAELAAALERIERVQRESDALREQLSNVTGDRHDAQGLAGEDRRRLDELQRDAEQSRARIDSLREHADELRAEAAQARAEAAEVRAELGGIQGSALGDLEGMKRAQAEMRELIENAQRDRDYFSAKTEAALSQLDDIRRQVQEHESSVSIKIPSQAVEREELTAVFGEARGEIEGLRRAEQALRTKLEALAGAGEAVAERVDALGGEIAQARGDATEAREDNAAARDEARQAGKAARELAQRVDEIDRGAGSVLADVRAVRDRLDEVSTLARADAEEARAAVARAAEAANAAREDAGRAREESASARRELETGRDRLTALAGEVQHFGVTLASAVQAAESAQTEATAARRSNKELTELVAELDSRSSSLRGELGAGKDRLQALDRTVAGLSGDVDEARTDAAGAKEEAKALRAELAEVRAIAERAAGGIDSIREDVETVRTQAETMTREAKEARDIVRAGQKRLEAMAAEVTFALSSLDDVKAGLTSAGQAAVIARREAEQAKKAAQSANDGSGVHSVNEVFAQLLGLANQRGGQSRRAPSSPHHKKPDPIKREPRHGFDDVSQPMAMLGLDGKFRELNPAFAKLVGYQEHEFAKATWPSPHDRSVYQQQQEELTKLSSGEIESVIVQSTYMHGQGLMVPVIGRITAVPGEDGLPLHLLLEAEDRHSSQ